MKKIINDKEKYRTRSVLSSSKETPKRVSSISKKRESFVVDSNGYFNWGKKQR